MRELLRRRRETRGPALQQDARTTTDAFVRRSHMQQRSVAPVSAARKTRVEDVGIDVMHSSLERNNNFSVARTSIRCLSQPAKRCADAHSVPSTGPSRPFTGRRGRSAQRRRWWQRSWSATEPGEERSLRRTRVLGHPSMGGFASSLHSSLLSFHPRARHTHRRRPRAEQP